MNRIIRSLFVGLIAIILGACSASASPQAPATPLPVDNPNGIECPSTDPAIQCPAAEQPALEGEWQLTAIEGVDGLNAVLPEARPTIAFDGDQVSGLASCNRFGGSFTLDGQAITFGPLMSTMMGCVDEVNRQESAVLDLLNRATSATFDGTALRIATDAGEVLVYSR